MDLLNKKKTEKIQKMTLSGYYESLKKVSPRTEFIRKIANEVGCSEMSVVGWCKGRRPHKYEHVIALSKATGIKPEDLWA